MKWMSHSRFYKCCNTILWLRHSLLSWKPPPLTVFCLMTRMTQVRGEESCLTALVMLSVYTSRLSSRRGGHSMILTNLFSRGLFEIGNIINYLKFLI